MPSIASPGENQDAGSSSRFWSFLKLVWVNLSIFVFIVIFFEIGAYLYYAARTALSGDKAAAAVEAIPDDAYADRSWLLTGLREPRGELQWEPYTYWRRPPFTGSYVNIDADGRRHTWNLPAKQAVEIYMFGGSTMWGIGARDDYTIPSFLSKQLAQAFPERVHVVNYGTTGFVSTQEMMLLFRELQRGCRPRIAIFYDGYNDTFSAFQNRVSGITLNEQNRTAEFNILQSYRTRDLFAATLKKSNIYHAIHDIHEELFRQKQLPSLPAKAENNLTIGVLNYYKANSDIIEAVGEKMEFSSLFYWQPTPYTRSNRNKFEESWLRDRAQQEFFSEVYANVKNSRLQTKTSFHDISDVFEGYEGTLYMDFAHTTERGNRIIAGRIFRDVAPLVEREIARLDESSDRSAVAAMAGKDGQCHGAKPSEAR